MLIIVSVYKKGEFLKINYRNKIDQNTTNSEWKYF